MRMLLAVLLAALSTAAGAFSFSDEEKARILQHGPWPPKRPLLQAGAVKLGERLFYEPRLSGTGSVLCASCHVPYRAFQDGRARAFGLELAARNTPSVIDVGFYRSFGWDGLQDDLGAQSIRPLLDAKEMRSSAARVARLLRERFEADFREAFGKAVPADDAEALADAGRALAAFQRTLVSARTPFDDFRDALERGDAAATARYAQGAKRGLALFVGGANCSVCHAGPRFTSEARVGGIRVPALRFVAATAPYMHDGRFPTLDDVLRGHAPRRLTPAERQDLAAFLETLGQVTRAIVRENHRTRDVRP